MQLFRGYFGLLSNHRQYLRPCNNAFSIGFGLSNGELNRILPGRTPFDSHRHGPDNGVHLILNRPGLTAGYYDSDQDKQEYLV